MPEEASTPNVPAWKKEFDDRLAKFAETVSLGLPTVKEGFNKLGMDGSVEEHLDWLGDEETVKFGDLREAFKSVGVVAIRAAMKHLRGAAALTNGGSEPASAQDALIDVIKSQRPKTDWSNKDLLEIYDQDQTEVAEVLQKRFHCHRCIVLNRDGTVNTEVTLAIMKVARKQAIPEVYRHTDGQMYRPYRPGDWPTEYVDASPFFPDKPLVNGYCDGSDTNWDGVSQEARILVNIHVWKVESAKLNSGEMKRICEAAKLGAERFRQDYQRAALIYDELADKDELPKLRIDPRNPGQPVPFGGRKDTGFGS